MVTYGCSTPIVSKAPAPVPVIVPVMQSAVVVPQRQKTSDIQKYEQEDQILAHILAYYEKILVAHREGDFGLAETLIDSAFIAYGNVNLDAITDSDLVARFTALGGTLSQEYGRILIESDRISQEDPESWIPDITDAEQFKSGEWTYEELKTIVQKISRKCDVPIDFNEKVRNMIYYFQTKGRDVMTKWQGRSGRYIPMMQNAFLDAGLPGDLAYLSMIESGFNPTVVSRARCVGLWQFAYATGKMYGLDRNEWTDERCDPVKSTNAAVLHITDLYRQYDDWNLVMAAYNSGAGTVARAVQSGINDFWRIDLPAETDNYVPTFLAALIISKAPEIFGFENIVKEGPFDFDVEEVRPYTSLKDAAKCAGVDLNTIKQLNPELLRDYTPSGNESYQLRIPKGCCGQFEAEYAMLPVERFVPPQPVIASTYRVKSGDTLSGIAKKQGVSLASLMKVNNLSAKSVIVTGQSLKIPGAATTASSAPKTAPAPATTVKAAPAGITGGTVSYTVKKDDTLWALANRYSTTVDALASINNFTSTTELKVGQVIRVPKNSETSSNTAPSLQSPEGNVTYVVQKNDSLSVIAQRYGVDYRDIMVWNSITDQRKIKPGDRLVIKTKG
jgi:membrane-bound lytic murein transglycosylase D